MEFRLELIGPHCERELLSLCAWLAEERALHGLVRTAPVVPGPPVAGRPSAGVTVTLTTATARGQLLIALMQWREARQPGSVPTVRVLDGGPGDAEALSGALRVPRPGA